MPADIDTLATLLDEIRDRALAAREAGPEAMQAALAEIAALAGRRGGDTPEPSDLPHSENQSL